MTSFWNLTSDSLVITPWASLISSEFSLQHAFIFMTSIPSHTRAWILYLLTLCNKFLNLFLWPKCRLHTAGGMNFPNYSSLQWHSSSSRSSTREAQPRTAVIFHDYPFFIITLAFTIVSVVLEWIWTNFTIGLPLFHFPNRSIKCLYNYI